MLPGFGLECARVAAHEGMNLVRVDVQADALASARAEIEALAAPLGGRVLDRTVEVSNAESMQALADEVLAQLGAPHAAGPGPQPHRPLPRADPRWAPSCGRPCAASAVIVTHTRVDYRAVTRNWLRCFF